MIKPHTLPVEIVRQNLKYNPATGCLLWAQKTGHRNMRKRVGYLQKDGYRRVSLLGRKFKTSRLAWVLMTGKWPRHQIDHINRVRHDDRWINLRDVTHSVNARNCSPPRPGMFEYAPPQG